MMPTRGLAIVVTVLALFPAIACAQVERIWLTHRSHDPSKVVVSWTTATPRASVVRFGLTSAYGEEARVAGRRTLHHVEIAVPKQDATYHYSVGEQEHASRDATFKSYPTKECRVAIVANWHTKADLSSLIKDDVHLLLTAGDNIPNLWQHCGAGKAECYVPYAQLIDAYPELFRSTPFLPVLGNHDREIRPRGNRPPSQPVYDIDATAFRSFFELPDDEWKWRFELPDFGLRLIALDFHHTSDFGTTWQTCHAFDRESEQFRWYQQQVEDPAPFIITLYNERHATMRGHAQGAWDKAFQSATGCISGFGHFGERAQVKDRRFWNTSLTGKGNQYPDPHSQALFGEDNYLLLTLKSSEKRLVVELKSLAGRVLDRTEIDR